MVIKTVNYMGLFLLVALIGVVISIHPYIGLIVTMSGAFLALLHIKKILYSCFLAIPSLFFSFLPSDYVLKFRITTPMGYVSPVFIVIIIQLLVMLLISLKNNKLKLLNRYQPLLISLTVFYACCVVSGLINQIPISGYKDLSKGLTLSLGILLLINWISRKENKQLAVVKIAVLASTIVSIFGVCEFIWGFEPYLNSYLSSMDNFHYNNEVVIAGSLKRIVSTIGNPLVLSAYLLLSIPFIFYLKDKSKSKLWWNISLCLHSLAVFFTFSRSAIIVLLAMYVTVILRKRKFKQLFLGTFILLLIGISGYLIINNLSISNEFMDRMLFKTDSGSLTSRYNAYFLVTELLSSNPLLGVGYGNNAIILQDYISSAGLGVNTLDNALLNTLTEVGILGFISLIVTFFSLGRCFSKMEPELGFTGYLLIFVLIGMSFSFNIIYFEAVWGTAWFFIGCLLSLNSINKQNIEKMNLQ